MDKKKIQKIEDASKKVQEAEENLDIIDVLLDEDNKEPIVLVDGNGRRISFEQIAVIPFNNKLYCVLKPIDKIDNIADDEAIVFFVHEEKGKEPVLMVETNEKVAMDVFDEYYNLLDEEEKKSKKSSTSAKTSSSTKKTASKSTKSAPKGTGSKK